MNEIRPPASPERRHHPVRNVILVLSAAAVGLIVAISAMSAPTTPVHQDVAVSQATNQPVASTPAQPTPVAPPQPSYSVPQQQAIASAESYLSDGQGFSKLGLIQQLSSHYGEGFSQKLARFAVNHVSVNWRHQAVLSARGYMSSQPGWSFNGLVQQLNSPFGENFTLAQAEYAAHKVGL